MQRNPQYRPLSPEGKRKLNHLFAALRRNKLAARQSFSCCGTCGSYEMSEMLKERTDLIGYAFYHQQDAARLHEEAGVYIGYDVRETPKFNRDGAADEVDAKAREIGRLIVTEAHKVGLFTKWDGKSSTRVYVSEVPCS